jgi:hypothetical protein
MRFSGRYRSLFSETDGQQTINYEHILDETILITRHGSTEEVTSLIGARGLSPDTIPGGHPD